MVEATKVTLDVNTRERWAGVGGVGAGGAFGTSGAGTFGTSRSGAFGTSGAEVETGSSHS